MPKLITYKRNAMIYIKGERSEDIFLLKEGSVVLLTNDENENRSSKKRIEKGEFFGLFSTMGKFPRQEDAISMSDIELLVFSAKEFESLISEKPKLSLQLMKMLSQDLRVIHKKSQRLLDHMPNKPEVGLYEYAVLYKNKRDTEKARYVMEHFLQVFPNHEKTNEVKEMLASLKD